MPSNGNITLAEAFRKKICVLAGCSKKMVEGHNGFCSDKHRKIGEADSARLKR